jgi:hypothetical protein
MRREKEHHLRVCLINDIYARWTIGDLDEETYKKKMDAYKEAVAATDKEMATITSTIEDRCMGYTLELSDKIRGLTNPSVQTLCRQLYEMWSGMWDNSVFVTRLEQFNTVYNSLKSFITNQIVNAVTATYIDMLARGVTFETLYARVENSMDVHYVIPGKLGERHTWSRIDSRLFDFLDNLSMASQGALARFVKDNQNIHTSVVTAQTNTALKVILETPLPAGQKTLSEIYAEWERLKLGEEKELSFGPPKRVDVWEDMKTWGAKSMITNENDYLYRNVLRHLWARIKAAALAIRDEVIRRLYEECHESLSMCAQGHIGRLANVLVGFDETIRPPVSLQDRMAEISRLNRTEAEKRAEAAIVLNDYDVPAEERSAWLDAF